MMDLLQSLLKSSYAKLLEKQNEELRQELAREREENRQLRAENRGLTNTLLGTAGHPPMTEVAKPATPHLLGRRSLHQVQARTEKKSVAALHKRVEVVSNPENAQAQGTEPEAQKAS